MTPRTPTLRRLLRLARPELPSLALGTLFLLVGSALGLLYPQGMRVLIDNAMGPKSRGTLDRAAAAMVVIALLQGGAIALRYLLFTRIGERVVTRLREQLYRAILSQETAFFDQRRTGELTSRLASDTTVLQGAVSSNISMGLRNLAQALGGIGFLLFTSPLLTAIMLSVVPAVAVGAVVYGRRIRLLARQVQDALAKASEIAEESIGGIRTVRSFTAEETEAKRYGGAIQHSYELAISRARSGGLFMGAATGAAYSAVALVFWVGARQLSQGKMTAGGLTSFLVYTMAVAFSVGGLADLWADFMKSLGAAERIFEIIDRPPAMPATGRTLAAPRGQVELRNVVFRYPSRPDVPVLQGIDLSLRAGEVVAVVGPSGAGKSTLAALLGRLYDPLSGEILFDGVDLRVLEPRWLRQQVGVVAQEPLLFSCSVADNIRYGKPGATDAEVEAAARAAHAHAFVSTFPEGYGTLVGERGIQLSGGQKQRVAIARAVLKDPRLLILDEATSALDSESEALVKDALDYLMRARTTLIIAHRLSTVVGAQRVLVLDGGRVVQSGSHAELLDAGGLYRKLVERQFIQA